MGYHKKSRKKAEISSYQELLDLTKEQLADEATSNNADILALFDPSCPHAKVVARNTDATLFAKMLVTEGFGPKLIEKIESKLTFNRLTNVTPNPTKVECHIVNWCILLLPKHAWSHLESAISCFSSLFVDALEKLPFPAIYSLISKDITHNKKEEGLLPATEFIQIHRNLANATSKEKSKLLLTLATLSPYYLFRYLEEFPHLSPYANSTVTHRSTITTSLYGNDYRWECQRKLHPVIVRTLNKISCPPVTLLRNIPSSCAHLLEPKQFLKYLFCLPYHTSTEELISYVKSHSNVISKVERILRHNAIAQPARYLTFCKEFNLAPKACTQKDVFRSYKNSYFYNQRREEALNHYCSYWLENVCIPLDLRILKETSTTVFKRYLHQFPEAYPISTLLDTHSAPWLLHPSAADYIKNLTKNDFKNVYIQTLQELHRLLTEKDNFELTTYKPPVLSRKEVLALLSILTERMAHFNVTHPFITRWESVDAALAANNPLTSEAAYNWLCNNVAELTASTNLSAEAELALKSYNSSD
jgi:hypothetical protein